MAYKMGEWKNCSSIVYDAYDIPRDFVSENLFTKFEKLCDRKLSMLDMINWYYISCEHLLAAARWVTDFLSNFALIILSNFSLVQLCSLLFSHPTLLILHFQSYFALFPLGASTRMNTLTDSIHICARKMKAKDRCLLINIYKYLLEHNATIIDKERLLVISQKLQQPRKMKPWPLKLILMWYLYMKHNFLTFVIKISLILT